MTRIYALGLVLAFGLVPVSPAFGQADGQKVLDGWAKLVVGGTWVTTRVTGETQENTFRWRIPGKLLELDGRGGPLPFVAMIAVDPATKQCAWNVYNDDGTTIKGTLTQPAAGVWIYEESGAGLQGPHRYKAKLTQVDANTVKEKPSDFVINGKPQPLDAATWKRIGLATRKDFEEYCQAWQGRWVGDITWVADWPGLGKRGEKATGYGDYRIVENGNALLGTFYGGGGSATLLTVFDEASKQIQERVVISNGYVSNGIVYKQDGQWRFRDAGGLPDGTKSTAVGTLTISDNGNTHTLTSTGTKGDKPTDPQNDVWRRMSIK